MSETIYNTDGVVAAIIDGPSVPGHPDSDRRLVCLDSPEWSAGPAALPIGHAIAIAKALLRYENDTPKREGGALSWAPHYYPEKGQ
jgi:hypothetical protein